LPQQASHTYRGRRALNGVLAGVGGTLGVLLVAWGLWILYTGIADVDPDSELPRWSAFALGVPVLAVGGWLVALVASAWRRHPGRART
jgi:hypothetical protein